MSRVVGIASPTKTIAAGSAPKRQRQGDSLRRKRADQLSARRVQRGNVGTTSHLHVKGQVGGLLNDGDRKFDPTLIDAGKAAGGRAVWLIRHLQHEPQLLTVDVDRAVPDSL